MSVALLAMLLGTPLRVLGQADRIQVEQDPVRFRSTVTIRSQNGRVEWADVLRGISQARGYDETAWDGLPLRGTFSVVGPAAELQLIPLNLALAPSVQFRIRPDHQRPHEVNLIIVLDRKALLASERRFKSWLRDWTMRRLSSTRDFGLRLDQEWEKRSPEKPLVVLAHGLHSRAVAVASLLERPRAAGFPCAEFDYPNDQAIADSAALLSRELRSIAAKHPERAIALVAHSMGGLVSRAVIEDPRLDPGNVRRLIMIGTPNQGSVLANFAYGIDLWEYTLDAARRKSVRAFLGSIEDGLADAQDDLRPGSLFLQELNARPRNPQVDYTIILGDVALLTDNDLQRARRSIQNSAEKSRWIRLFGPKVDGWLKELDEVVDGRGDGVVSVERGKLEGVSDTLVLHFGHLDFIGQLRREGAVQAAEEVMKRIEAMEP
ncbi:MAG: lipase family alpha/beta hydrolase [Pirellulaceae bacterium]